MSLSFSESSSIPFLCNLIPIEFNIIWVKSTIFHYCLVSLLSVGFVHSHVTINNLSHVTINNLSHVTINNLSHVTINNLSHVTINNLSHVTINNFQQQYRYKQTKKTCTFVSTKKTHILSQRCTTT